MAEACAGGGGGERKGEGGNSLQTAAQRSQPPPGLTSFAAERTLGGALLERGGGDTHVRGECAPSLQASTLDISHTGKSSGPSLFRRFARWHRGRGGGGHGTDSGQLGKVHSAPPDSGSCQQFGGTPWPSLHGDFSLALLRQAWERAGGNPQLRPLEGSRPPSPQPPRFRSIWKPTKAAKKGV